MFCFHQPVAKTSKIFVSRHHPTKKKKPPEGGFEII
jgi:hypothetical protein